MMIETRIAMMIEAVLTGAIRIGIATFPLPLGQFRQLAMMWS